MKKYLLKLSEQRELIVKDKLLFKFYKTMLQNDYEYKYLNYNIKNLKISPIRFPKIKLKKINAIAYYNCKKNEIKYIKSKKEQSLPHELMHMSSTVKEEDGSIFSGFSQKTREGEFLLIGSRFNEGYTQLLTERYFPYASNVAYPIEKLITFQVEKILGKKEMEQMYFKADLMSLIEELSKYKSESDILNFICSVDFFENIYTKSWLLNNLNEIKNSYLYIICFLTSIKIEKLKEQELDNDEIKEKIKVYIDTFELSLNIKGDKMKYEIANKDMLDDIYNDYCKCLDSNYTKKTYSK